MQSQIRCVMPKQHRNQCRNTYYGLCVWDWRWMLANANLYPFHFPIEFWRRENIADFECSVYSLGGVCYAENFTVKSLAYIFGRTEMVSAIGEMWSGTEGNRHAERLLEKKNAAVRAPRKKIIFVADWVLIKNKNKVQKMYIKYERQMILPAAICRAYGVFRFYVLLFVAFFLCVAFHFFGGWKWMPQSEFQSLVLIWKATQNRNKRIASC